MKDEELLTERITVRFTATELKSIERFMKREGDRKPSTFLRRIMILYIQKKTLIPEDAADLPIYSHHERPNVLRATEETHSKKRKP